MAPQAPDEAYAEEAAALRAAGLGFSLFSLEAFEAGSFRPRPALPADARVVYRGWMLGPRDYTRLEQAVQATGAGLRTDAAAYRLCHHLPQWYAHCADLTPATLFAAEHDHLGGMLAQTGWRGVFIKDHVKSLTTVRGSAARTPAEVAEVVRLLRQFRGGIEGGLCLREFVELVPGSEVRYFVVGGRVHAEAGPPPAIVEDVARRPFFSVDVALRQDGSAIVIELGDGQVSDRKSWPARRMVEVAAAA